MKLGKMIILGHIMNIAMGGGIESHSNCCQVTCVTETFLLVLSIMHAKGMASMPHTAKHYS